MYLKADFETKGFLKTCLYMRLSQWNSEGLCYIGLKLWMV